MNKKNPYNKGDKYEDLIFKSLKSVDKVAGERGGASSAADIKLQIKGARINIECKYDGADYGQKYISYIDGKWSWNNPDVTTDLYDGMRIKEYINKDFVPYKTKDKCPSNMDFRSWCKQNINEKEKKYDQKGFEKNNITISKQALYEYYKKKKCYYIQIHKAGLFHLSEDKFDLGTPQYNGKLVLRFRAKSINNRIKSNIGKIIEIKDINGIFKKVKVLDLEEGVANKRTPTVVEYNGRAENIGGAMFTKSSLSTPWNYNFLAVLKSKRLPDISNISLDSNDRERFKNFLNI